jgi:hypothetical protein
VYDGLSAVSVALDIDNWFDTFAFPLTSRLNRLFTALFIEMFPDSLDVFVTSIELNEATPDEVKEANEPVSLYVTSLLVVLYVKAPIFALVRIGFT